MSLGSGKNTAQSRSEDKTVGWHHRLNGHEFEQALGEVKDREAWRAAARGVTKSQT